MIDNGFDPRSDTIVNSAMDLGTASGNIEPRHLLVALSEDEGAAARLLRPGGVRDGLRAAISDSETGHNSAWVDYRTRQVIGSAHTWASAQRTLATPEHLLVALAEQAGADVVAMCAANGIDLGAARERALTELGWSNADVPSLEPLEPAGTMDRPALPLRDLPTDVWAELEARQRRLPLARIRRTWEWEALRSNESRVAWNIVATAPITDDERYSLLHYHHEEIEQRAANAIPELSAHPPALSGGLFTSTMDARPRRGLVPEGWICWLGNRRVGMRNRWFRLTWRY